MCGTRGRPCQPLWKSRILIDACPIELILGQEFCLREIRSLQVGLLEIRPVQRSLLEMGLYEILSEDPGFEENALQEPFRSTFQAPGQCAARLYHPRGLARSLASPPRPEYA
jgi:hypothetical protein